MRATIELAGGAVTILPRRAPVGNSGPIRGRTLTVLPGVAAYPESFSATVEPDGQAARAILDLTEAGATTAARALGLAEILFWDGRRAHLLDCRQV